MSVFADVAVSQPTPTSWSSNAGDTASIGHAAGPWPDVSINSPDQAAGSTPVGLFVSAENWNDNIIGDVADRTAPAPLSVVGEVLVSQPAPMPPSSESRIVASVVPEVSQPPVESSVSADRVSGAALIEPDDAWENNLIEDVSNRAVSALRRDLAPRRGHSPNLPKFR